MMRLDDPLLSHCRNVAYTVAPELLAHPLYILDGSVFDGLPITRQCLGWATDGTATDYEIKARIGSAWNGPGPVVCLHGDEIESQYGPELFRDGTLNTLLHELAHILPPARIPKDDMASVLDTPAIREWQRSKRIGSDARPDPAPGSADDHHGLQFVRIATHLWARSTLAGWNIPGLDLFGCWHYSQPAHFVATLLREIFDFRQAPFAEIVSTDPPAQFVELFDGCVNLYHNRLRGKL